MKKIVSLLLTVCMCLSIGVMLTACGHECTYEAEWSYNDTKHWHDCEDEDCYEGVADEAEHSFTLTEATEQNHTMTCLCGKVMIASHSWSDWVVTVEPTKESAGTRVRACSTCEYELELPVQYEPVTTVNSYGLAIQSLINSENYQIKFSDSSNLGGQHRESTYSYIGENICEGSIYWTVEDGVKYQYYRVSGNYVKETNDDIASRYDMRKNFISNMLYFIDFTKDFEYSESWKAYEGSNIQIALFSDVVGMESAGVKTYDKVRLYFEDNQLTGIELELGSDSLRIGIKYGTADFTVPTVD
ncbi:MAG: hypothetical protein IJY65_04265 [Clostridia bacterium]|nr:hypothetical protein [Clostridia bacterium]